MSIPIIDFSELSGNKEEKRECSQAILKSLSNHGFVRLINHQVPDVVIDEIFTWADQFFALPAEQKLEIGNVADGSPQRGYSAIGKEKTASLYRKKMGLKVSPDLTDAREHFDVGAPNDEIFPNQWPAESQLPNFRAFMEKYFLLLEGQCAQILHALEFAMNLPTSTFTQFTTRQHNASELRLNHYPPITLDTMREGTVNRIWPHFDLGVITLLFASDVGGLEVEDRANVGKFIPIQPSQSSELIVNISETMQRWTNDVLPAGLHQVGIPAELREQDQGTIPRRYSVAYLCKADRDASVGSLDIFTADREGLYDDITALDYHKKRLQTAY
ncbi:oxidase [Hyphodiscus hymeniophilus]|uniref:Oxidase n=1 Tax=Hyphodiscus hymeniophilus TaxID=353542 RepID=A0A9P6SLP6_9HELO|nr:oxidase [Hyphodiscus hymeniophilus]